MAKKRKYLWKKWLFYGRLLNIKILAKKYTNNLPLIEKYTAETIKNLKPKLLNLSLTFFLNELEKNKNNNYLKQIDESLSDLMGEKFLKLRPRVRLHEDLFFYVLTQIEKEVLNNKVDYDMNILYWVTLYHDIWKFQNLHEIYEKDYIYGTFDKMHPFKSIIIFIQSLIEKKII